MWKHLESDCSFTGTHPQTVVDSFASTSVFILCLLLIQVIPGVSGALTTMVQYKSRTSAQPGKHGAIILGQVGT